MNYHEKAKTGWTTEDMDILSLKDNLGTTVHDVLAGMDFNFRGFPKKNFRELMISHWMKEGCFETRDHAVINYGGRDFDKLCTRCDGKTLLIFRYDIGTENKECFETIDDNFVIPVSAINIYN